MDKETFTEIITKQLIDHYHADDLTAETWRFWWEELGGLNEKELSEAIRIHKQNMKSMAQPAHILEAHREGKKKAKKSTSYQMHPEWNRHQIAMNNLIRGDNPSNDTYLIDLPACLEKAKEISTADYQVAGTAMQLMTRRFAEAI